MNFFDTLKQNTETERKDLFAAPIIRDALSGDIELQQYTAFLTQAYHHVKHTVPLLMACGSRLGPKYEWLRTAVAEYIEEEIGHEEWILSDISACGGNADAARQSRPNGATELMVSYAYHQIDRGNPLGFFGMVHVLEGTSTAIATQAASAIQQALKLPAGAFTYLNSHGSLDLDHVRYFEGLMNRLDDDADKQAIIHCARMFYKLYGDIFRSLPSRESLFEAA
ncbi:iron-containing redox enzyme family protein [Oxalobacteraceae bacterium R-40]|uniref:Iron-containing redox enzyme family protein n=1 Tax=Keguizhuia sedimenti TaxID=3064264 RepID=A0ABU1BP10_9BURK|nr:iron-containing redox enzyme family protein [Oxalobacteraceae bacterium R-40]